MEAIPKKLKSKSIYILEALAMLSASLFLIAASFSAFPCADDYFYSKSTHEAVKSGNLFEVVGAAVYTQIYLSADWLALYSPATLQALQPEIFGVEFYWLTCPIMIAFSFAGFAFLSYSLSRYILNASGRTWIALAGLMWLFFLITMPSPSEGLYWWNGAANYIPFWSGAAITIGLMIKYYGKNERGGGATIVLASILAFVVAGGHQVDSFSMILMQAYICLISIASKRKFPCIIPLAVAIIGFSIMAMHPGTAQRANTLGGAGVSAFEAAKLAISQVHQSFLTWFDFRLFVYLCLLVPFIAKFLAHSEIVDKYLNGKTIILFSCLGVLYLFGIYCVPCYALGYGGPGRLLNVVYATFIVLVTIITFLIVGTIYKRLEPSAKYQSVSAAHQVLYVGVAFVLLFTTNNNVTAAFAEFKDGSLETYRQEMLERFEIIETSDGGDVVVPELSVRPWVVFFDDIREDPKDWRNVHYKDYFSLDSIRTQHGSE